MANRQKRYRDASGRFAKIPRGITGRCNLQILYRLFALPTTGGDN